MITVNNLVKGFDDIQVLNGISFNIEKGEIFGIIGESGSGKSTLLRCLNGLVPYNSGEVLINGTDISKLSPKALLEFRENIGMIFQNFSLVKRLTVYENIALPLKIRKVSKEDIDKKVVELAKIIGIESKLKQMPSSLSGGQQQRVAIARALVTDPEIILSDESTSALDPSTTKSILRLLNRLNEELNVTIVMVSHEFDVISEVCDRVLFLDKGKCSAIEKPEELFLKESTLLEGLVAEEDVTLPRDGINFEVLIHLPKDNLLISKLSELTNNTLKVIDSVNYNFKNGLVVKFKYNIDEKFKTETIKLLEDKEISWRQI
ncbi:ATP-binding cassette domain-containing protein [Lagierella sp.]|uniref:methionine ABC transporter ATP-binding protein n=1 Tax=Lagierella sp. TaxID=2849657 RepID=UPI002610570A|nr:ATP-binding cassette domain-containing protein [Lagierella sp.]